MLQCLNRKSEGKQTLSEDGWWRDRGGAGLWFHRLGQAKLLKSAFPTQSGFLCFVSPYSLPREAAEEKT